MITRREQLEKHDNNYGFDVSKVLSLNLNQGHLPKVSIVIPYFETGYIFDRCIYFMKRAMSVYSGSTEIIIIDDGSVHHPLTKHLISSKDVHTVTFKKNRGRTEARNAGLSRATGEIILFIDSDVLVNENLIVNHVKLHSAALERTRRAICVEFFEFTDLNSKKIVASKLKSGDIGVNDFRIDCTYGATWIGCEEDMRYVGRHMRIVDETQNFRTWQGKFRAWVLPNMILGGAFSVLKGEIDAVGGFDTRFTGYGFTETSAVTRMITERDNVVVPCLAGGAIHVEDDKINIPRIKKDEIFKKRHDFYFNQFLEEQIQ